MADHMRHRVTNLSADASFAANGSAALPLLQSSDSVPAPRHASLKTGLGRPYRRLDR
jgi:hypothetical protein